MKLFLSMLVTAMAAYRQSRVVVMRYKAAAHSKLKERCTRISMFLSED